MITYEHNQHLSESDCQIIIHNFGVHSTMDGKTNMVLNLKYPNIYYNLCLKRKCKHLRRGDFLITRIDKQYFISICTSFYDFDGSVSSSQLNEETFALTLQAVLECLKDLGLDKLSIGAPAYFGAKKNKTQKAIKQATNQIFGDINITFFDKI